MTDIIDELPSRRAHLARIAANVAPKEFAADDLSRQANIPSGPHRVGTPASAAVARGPYN